MQNPCRHHPLLMKLQWLQCIWCHHHHLPGYLMLAPTEKGSSLWMMKRRGLLHLHSGWLDRLNPRCQLAGRTTWCLCWVFLGNSIVMSHDGCVSELTGLSCCKYGKPCNKTIQGLHPAGLAEKWCLGHLVLCLYSMIKGNCFSPLHIFVLFITSSTKVPAGSTNEEPCRYSHPCAEERGIR